MIKRLSHHSKKNSGFRLLKAALCVFAAMTLTVTATGCRDTDALKEIIIDQNADLIDYDNPEKFYINDSTSEEESNVVSSLEVSEEEPDSDQVQNLIVYSSEPNTEGYTAKHSMFSAFPDFLGIEASDTVFFYQSDSVDAFEHEVTPTPDDEEFQPPEDEQEKLQSERNINPIVSTTTTTTSRSGSPSTTASGSGGGSGENSADNAEGAGESGEGDSGEANEGSGGASSEPTEGGGGAGGDADAADENGDGGGNNNEGAGEEKPDLDEMTAWNPNDPDEYAPHSESFAAFGDYARIVQMIGGNGALAATDADTLNGLVSNGVGVSALQAWDGDGSDPLSIDAQAIVDSGAQFVIVEDVYTYSTGMTSAAYNLLYDNGIQFYPMKNMCTSTNIKINVDSIGTSLQGSSAATNGDSAEARAGEYRSRHDDMVGKNGGLASDYGYGGTTSKVLQGSNDRDSLDWSGNLATYTVLIDYWDSGATLNNAGMLFDPGTAYASAGFAQTPVSYYMQAGGTINTAAARTIENAYGEIPVLQLMGGDGTGGSGSWSYTSLGDRIYSGRVTALLDSQVDINNQGVGQGLGSDVMPKVIVADSFIKDSMFNSSFSYSSLYHPYDFTSTGGGISDFLGLTFSDERGGTAYTATSIGYRGGSADVGTPNPSYSHDDGNYIDYDDILVNPSGLFCDWTGGSVESFLESGWVASRINGVYDYEQWKQDVSDFYSWAWGITPDVGAIDPN